MIDCFVKDMFLDGDHEVMQYNEFVRYRLTLEQGSPSLESKLDSILTKLDMLYLVLCKVDPNGLKGLDRRSTILLQAARTRVGVEISTPDDPVHLTHVRFNTSAEEFTGLTEELQQILQGSGISRTEQDKNPKAAAEVVKFYREGARGTWDVWDKMGGAPKTGPPILPAPPPSKPLMGKSFLVCLFTHSLPHLVLKLKSNSDRHHVHQISIVLYPRVRSRRTSGPHPTAVPLNTNSCQHNPVLLQGGERRRIKKMIRTLSRDFNRFALMRIPPGCIATSSRLELGERLSSIRSNRLR
jgi:hypothetical protein